MTVSAPDRAPVRACILASILQVLGCLQLQAASPDGDVDVEVDVEADLATAPKSTARTASSMKNGTITAASATYYTTAGRSTASVSATNSVTNSADGVSVTIAVPNVATLARQAIVHFLLFLSKLARYYYLTYLPS
jgi:hypothetical protein